MRKLLIIVGCALAVAVLAATQSQRFSGNLIVAGSITDPDGLPWIKEAPITGTNYVRYNGGWAELPAGSGSGDGDLIAGVGIILDGTLTDRLAGAGNVTIQASVEDAPFDGVPYIRKDENWESLYTYAATASHTHSGVYEPVFSKGSLVQGTGISLSGTLSSRLVGSGDVTIGLGTHSHDWADITGEPTFSLDGHAHAASDITSGILPIARGGTGGGTQGDARTALDVPSRSGSGASGTWGISISGDAGTLDGVDSTGFATSGHNHSGVYEPVFSKGDLVAGSGTSLSGTLTGRLFGSGNVTITSTGTGVTDHGALTGLGDDDHTQYHTDARGDARYSLLSHNHSGTYEPAHSEGDLAAGSGISLSGTLTGRLIGSGTVTVSLGSHTHAISDTTGLQAALDGKSNTGHTHSDLANFVFVTVSEATDSNSDSTFRSVLGTVKTGYSATLGSGTLATESVIKVEAAGVFDADSNFEHKVRLKIGSSYYIEFICNEPASGKVLSGTPWNLTAWITVTSAGSSATVHQTSWMEYHTDESVTDSTTSASYAFRTRGTSSGTLNTTTSNTVDLTYAGMSATANAFSCRHFILQQY